MGDPLDFIRSSQFERISDFCLPVKHGLSLDVRRVFSTREFFDDNQNGNVALGYSHGDGIMSNWNLYLYETRIRNLGSSFLFIGESGEWVRFNYVNTATYDVNDSDVNLDSRKLKEPTQAAGSVIASKFIPIVGGSFGRQTREDLTLYVLHNQDPGSSVYDPMNITGYVLRNAKGQQYHFVGPQTNWTQAGYLHYVDANWRNNVPFGATGHVDDYLRVEWRQSSSLGTATGNVWTIDCVYAPPSDGRYLRFNHPDIGGGLGIRTHVSSVDLIAPGQAYTNLVRYEYRASGRSAGKLWRVRNGNNMMVGTQYDYGDIKSWTDGQPDWTTDQPGSSEDCDTPILSLISKFEQTGPTTYVVTPYVATDRQWIQWMRDPVQNYWRKSVSANPGYNVQYHGGEIEGAQDKDRYNEDYTYSTSQIVGSFDITEFTYYNAPNPPQPSRRNFIPGTRLVDSIEVKVGANWLLSEKYTYADNSGIDRPTAITKYSSDLPASAQTTTFAYLDSNRPDLPSQIDYPDGRRVVNIYRPDGQLYGTESYRKNSVTGTYVLQHWAFIEYLASGVNAGLPWRIVTYMPDGQSKSTTITYTEVNGNKAGKVASTTSDGKTVSYTYDDFGNALTVQTSVGTATNVYSGPGQTDTMVPPRLLRTTGPNNVVTAYGYDSHSRVSSVTAAYGTPDAKQTTYQYDRYDHVITVNAPGPVSVSYSYDIYGNLSQLQDAQGNTTRYTYDAFGRLVKETPLKTDSEDPLYTINYTYSDGTSGCGSCGGDPNKISKREIVSDNANVTETLYFKYDLMGRLTAMGTTIAADDYLANYDGTRLTGIVHKSGTPFALWGNGSLGFTYDSLGRLQREVYPSGRYNEFSYDGYGRISSVKDPFGFVNKVEYDSDMRFWKLTHSALGTATLTYNNTTDDLPTRLTLGNGAYTDFGYDSLKRLNSFEHYQTGSPAMFFRHGWSYDNLSRKGALDVNVPELGCIGGTTNTLTPTYDAAGRLSREKLVTGGMTRWDQQYGYDYAGNRVSYNDNGTQYAIGYNAVGQNRESDVLNGSPLQYDFKGNVTVRPPLAVDTAFNYTWDAFDRLRTSTHSGGATVNYTYDALGRLLKRTSNSSSNGGTTVNYWLGLNRIAEEKWVDSGADQAVFRPDNEVGTTPQANGWGIYRAAPSGTMAYETDPVRGNVLRLSSGSSAAGSGVFVLGDSYNGNDNIHGSAWGTAQENRRHIGMWVKNADPAHAPIRVGVLFVDVDTESEYNLGFVTDSGIPSVSGGCLTYHLGSGSDTNFNDGQWHYLELDVTHALQAVVGDELTVAQISGLTIKGSRVYVDDIIVSGGALVRTYQGGLGSWGITDWRNQESRVYYHYNDLGTVVATSDMDGHWSYIVEPDHFGNYYRYHSTSGSRPLEMGLTGKFFDSDSGLYYFNARWYDSERGRWMSEDPIGFAGGLNLYGFVENDPYNLIDLLGLCPPDNGKGESAHNNMGSNWPLGVKDPSKGSNWNGGYQIGYKFSIGKPLGNLIGLSLEIAQNVANKGIPIYMDKLGYSTDEIASYHNYITTNFGFLGTTGVWSWDDIDAVGDGAVAGLNDARNERRDDYPFIGALTEIGRSTGFGRSNRYRL